MVSVRSRKEKSMMNNVSPRRIVVQLLPGFLILYVVFLYSTRNAFNISQEFLLQATSSSKVNFVHPDTWSSEQRSAFDREKNESLVYIHSFDRNSFKRKLEFFHIPKTAGTAIEHAAGATHPKHVWGSCMFNHKRKRSDCAYPDGGECKFITTTSTC